MFRAPLVRENLGCDVFPCLPMLFADFPERSGVLSDCPHLLVGQLSHSICLSHRSLLPKHRKTVSDILTGCNPFKIIRPVVMFDTVFMIDLMAIWARPNERFSNKSMNLLLVLNASGIECHKCVALSESRFKNSRWMSPRWNIASDSAKVANRIKRLFRDCFPDFIRGIDFIRHAWPFSLRLRLFRCAHWFTRPLGVPKL